MYKKLCLVIVMVFGLAAGLADGQTEVQINFQPCGSEVPEGYLMDCGEVFADRGNGFSYGWDRVFNAGQRDRNSSRSPDQRWDTLIHLQKGDPVTWEIALPNGMYNVHMVCGDPAGPCDSIHNMDVEGVVVEDTDPLGQISGAAFCYAEYNVTVAVSDGRLTIKPAPDAVNSKIAFVDIILAVPQGAASNPNPANEATDVPRDVVLSWTPGEFAPPIGGHKVYLSENFNDVNDGIGGIAQDANSYAPDPRLDLGTTYYWRIDEVNDADPDSPWKGEVWSFTVEPCGNAMKNIIATASSSQSDDTGPQKTVDGSGLNSSDLHSTDAKDMWLSDVAGPQPTWIRYEFDGIYKLHEMWVWNQNQVVESTIGFGAKDVTIEYSTDGFDWLALGSFEFAQAPGLDDYSHNTTVDFGGVPAKHVRLTVNSNWGAIVSQYGLSEVRFFNIPIRAREPSPDSEAADVNVDVVLSFRAGREAASHEIYLGSAMDDLALVATVTETSYDPLSLDLGETYYWKVNEVNEAADPSIWEGDIWTFSTQEYLVVDDFESYNDLDLTDPESNRIFLAWLDGYDIPTNGSLVGYDVPPFAEQTIVHSGNQSMPLHYGQDSAANSEATRTFASAQDWTRAGAATLVLYFYGESSNTGGQLYVKINGTKVVHTGALAQPYWRQWNIDLASVGANLQNVTSMSIGVDGAGSSGLLYIDDILLYKEAPGMASEQIWIEAESANTIALPMEVFTGDAASGGQFIGTRNGIGNSTSAPPDDGIASYSFTVAGGTYKIQLRVNGDDGNSLWVRIPGATTNIKIHESGWVLNETPGENYWNWDDVTSRDGGGDTVHFTLGPGTHILDITYREDGCLLDSIVITDKLD